VLVCEDISAGMEKVGERHLAPGFCITQQLQLRQNAYQYRVAMPAAAGSIVYRYGLAVCSVAALTRIGIQTCHRGCAAGWQAQYRCRQFGQPVQPTMSLLRHLKPLMMH
jgi:hypothetical protein